MGQALGPMAPQLQAVKVKSRVMINNQQQPEVEMETVLPKQLELELEIRQRLEQEPGMEPRMEPAPRSQWLRRMDQTTRL